MLSFLTAVRTIRCDSLLRVYGKRDNTQGPSTVVQYAQLSPKCIASVTKCSALACVEFQTPEVQIGSTMM